MQMVGFVGANADYAKYIRIPSAGVNLGFEGVPSAKPTNIPLNMPQMPPSLPSAMPQSLPPTSTSASPPISPPISQNIPLNIPPIANSFQGEQAPFDIPQGSNFPIVGNPVQPPPIYSRDGDRAEFNFPRAEDRKSVV